MGVSKFKANWLLRKRPTTLFFQHDCELQTVYGNETCKPQPPDGFLDWKWSNAVGTARQAEGTGFNTVVTIAGKLCNGFLMIAEYIWEKIACAVSYTSDKLTWVAKWMWSGLTCLVEWVRYRVAWVAHGTWDIVASIVNFFAALVNYVWDGCTDFYASYLKGK